MASGNVSSTMARNVPVSPAPSLTFATWVFNAPVRDTMVFPHRGVYYAAEMNPQNKRAAMLKMKRDADAAARAFRAEQNALVQKASELAKASPSPAALVSHCVALNRAGLVDVASPTVLDLARRGHLDVTSYAAVIHSLAADGVVDALSASETDYDRFDAMKRAAEWGGSGRAREASTLLDMAAQQQGGKPTVQQFNALMAAYNTCGFTEASRVHGQVYDALGTHQVQPNAATYREVIRSLCLTGNPQEADAVFKFLRHRCPEAVTGDMLEALMWGHAFERDFSRCDELWTEAVTLRSPRPDVRLAEQYLRSIFRLADTPLAEPHKFFDRMELNMVELKRVPVLLKQFDQLGIPKTHLSAPTFFRAFDAVRRYSIEKRHFYDWGRSTKQFGFIDWRRRRHALDGITEALPPVRHVGSMRAGEATLAQRTVPEHIMQRPSWESQPLLDVMNDITLDEATGRGRAKFHQGVHPYHERSETWMNEVPETRYDKLYGLANPNMAKLGVRRQLIGERPDKEDLERRDRWILSRTLAGARRARTAVERQRTHRD